MQDVPAAAILPLEAFLSHGEAADRSGLGLRHSELGHFLIIGAMRSMVQF